MSYGEIQKTVNSNLGKPLDTLIEEKTGTVNATGGTAIAGGIFAKLNKLLTDWTTARAGKIDTIDTNVGTLMNGRVIKSVQKGVTVISMNQSAVTHNIPISPVNLNKAFVSFPTSVWRTGSNTYSGTLFCSLSSSTNVEIKSVGNTYIGGDINLSWQVIEFY